MSCDLDFCPFELKTGIPRICVMGYICTNFHFSAFLCFRVTSPGGIDGWTDRRARCVMQPTGWPHNNNTTQCTTEMQRLHHYATKQWCCPKC